MPLVHQDLHYFVSLDLPRLFPTVRHQVMPKLDEVLEKNPDLHWGQITFCRDQKVLPFSSALEAMRIGGAARFVMPDGEITPWHVLWVEDYDKFDPDLGKKFTFHHLAPQDHPTEDTTQVQGIPYLMEEESVEIPTDLIACFGWEVWLPNDN